MPKSARKAASPPTNDQRVDYVLSQPESYAFECKRIGGNRIEKILETIVAFANSDGGTIALGVEDPEKEKGRKRLFGIQEKLENWDELRRKLKSRITEPDSLSIETTEIECVLNNGTTGSIVLLEVAKSPRVHSIVDDGTFVRLVKGNRQISATEINELSYARGSISAESQIVDVDFDLLKTSFWRAYAEERGITRTIENGLFKIGLAKKDANGQLRPTMAAVLLFAEHPSGVLAGKTSIRIFHYHGPKASTDPNTNLVKPPITVDGPLIQQIREARQVLIRELGQRVQFTQLGFEIVQKYPVRVLTEAITNAVVHRDYRLPSDIFIRIFSDRIEVESPGLLISPVTPFNIRTIGTYPRNKLIVQHLREFPEPPNLDAGEGVRMMYGTMRELGLYPPLYRTRPYLPREAVVTVLLNQNRPSIWEQVVIYIEEHGDIGNYEVRKLLETNDTLSVSKQLKAWVEQGLLQVANPDAGRNVRRYTLPSAGFRKGFFSKPNGKDDR